MKILVLGGTGTVGSHVVHELLARDADVRVLTRTAEKAEGLPEGVEGVIGDLLEPETVRSVFRNTDGVFLLNPVSTTETSEGLMALNGIRTWIVTNDLFLKTLRRALERCVACAGEDRRIPPERKAVASPPRDLR